MDTRNQLATALPFRPPLQLLVRPELFFFPAFVDRVAAFAELHHLSFFYLDDTNDARWPARSVLSAGASTQLLASHLALEVRVDNLLDAQATDVLSRPLPGRELRIALTVREDVP
jgi:hypothetical protein